MIDVAFVCLGNICRSTMAEAIMRQRLKNAVFLMLLYILGVLDVGI